MMDFIGQTLGQYRIEAPLGSGGMGEVFRGVHLQLNRPAAIKVMQAQLAADPGFRSRFLQEARTAAALRHPNIVEIYDFGEQDGTLYLVMELMADGSLRSILRHNAGQPLPLVLGLDLVRQAANGLAAASAIQMVHRDIKPDNLLLTRLVGAAQGSNAYILKISDFGLARLLAQGGPLTTTGMPMGTLAYMSPEQCQGQTLDGRSDLYSLGIVLYEVITGYQPFQINDFGDALNKHVNTPPPPLGRSVPPGLEEIVARCLAKKPEDRYATGADLAFALQQVLSQLGWQAVTPPPPSSATSTPVGRTVLQPPSSGATPPPMVSTLATYAAVPRVRVLDQSGQTLQVVEMTNRGLIVGRQSNNDIALPSEAVSRQHLRVTWDGVQVSVTDLGSINGTLLGEVRLLPQVSQVWDERQMLHIGPFWLRLEGPSPDGTQTVMRGMPQTSAGRVTSIVGAQTSATMVRSGRIGMTANPRTLTITPGQSATMQVVLTNVGDFVDWFATTVEGVPPEWVQGTGQEVQLNPGMQETVDLSVMVARTPANVAQEYPVMIRARSRKQPGESGTTQARWVVQPFKEDTLRLEPRRASGHGGASYSAVVQNGGNTPAHYELSGEDDEQSMTYQFRYNPLDLAPGQEARVPVMVRSRRHWLGREQRQPFQVHARPAGSSLPLSAQGELVNKALLPVWLVPAALVVVATGVVLAALLGPLRPGAPQKGLVTPTVALTSTPTPGVSPTATGSPTAGSSPTTTPSPTVSPTSTPVPPPGGAWTVQSRVTPNNLNSVAWSGSKYVAVGVSGTILSSTDGKSWSIQSSGVSSTLYSVTWTGTQFVAVGDAGTILTSSDGAAWTKQNPSSNDAFVGVVSSQTLIVTIGSGGTILTSSDGVFWTTRTSPGTTLSCITYTGEQFIIAGDGIYSSSDGITWNTIPSSGASSIFSSIAYSGAKYVAVGGSTIYTSLDAFTWSSVNAGTSNELIGVTWTGTQFLVVGADGTILTSKDGSTWTSQNSGTPDALHGAVSSGKQYVVVGGAGAILTSP
jgi:eukaryotic-like serine/threonine-protein kinase